MVDNFLNKYSKIIDWLVGPYKQIFTGHSSDRDLRYECSSGGLGTALLKYLLEKGIVQGVIIAVPIPKNPIKHHMCRIDTIEKVIENKGSVYCQVDHQPVWNILQNNKDRIAVTGLPCQLKALDHFIEKKELNSSKIIKIGLFCGGVCSHKALEFLCKRKRIKTKDILKIRYRSGGWPGRKIKVTIRDVNNPNGKKDIILLNKSASKFQKYLYNFCFGGPFFLKACQNCRDQTAETADISLGDAWLPSIMSTDSIGTNIIIARTELGQEILQGAINEEIIEMNEANAEDVVFSQSSSLIGRKLGLLDKISWKHSHNNSEIETCKKCLKRYMPKKRSICERKVFHKLLSNAPTSLVFMFFLMYRLTTDALEKITLNIIHKSRSTDHGI